MESDAPACHTRYRNFSRPERTPCDGSALSGLQSLEHDSSAHLPERGHPHVPLEVSRECEGLQVSSFQICIDTLNNIAQLNYSPGIEPFVESPIVIHRFESYDEELLESTPEPNAGTKRR